MSSYLGYYADQPVATASNNERMSFIRRTYATLAIALFAFLVILTILFKAGVAEQLFRAMMSIRFGFLIAFALFIGGTILARSMAFSSGSAGVQYTGLILYTLLEALIVSPLIYLAYTRFPNAHIPEQAGIMTLMMTGGLTAIVFFTKKDFTFLYQGIMIASFLALGTMICAIIFGFQLGMIFTVIIIAINCAMILYTTSAIQQEAMLGQHVGAALMLFAAIGDLFYNLIVLLIQLQGGGD
jgi:uncharacterized protein